MAIALKAGWSMFRAGAAAPVNVAVGSAAAHSAIPLQLLHSLRGNQRFAMPAIFADGGVGGSGRGEGRAGSKGIRYDLSGNWGISLDNSNVVQYSDGFGTFSSSYRGPEGWKERSIDEFRRAAAGIKGLGELLRVTLDTCCQTEDATVLNDTFKKMNEDANVIEQLVGQMRGGDDVRRDGYALLADVLESGRLQRISLDDAEDALLDLRTSFMIGGGDEFCSVRDRIVRKLKLASIERKKEFENIARVAAAYAAKPAAAEAPKIAAPAVVSIPEVAKPEVAREKQKITAMAFDDELEWLISQCERDPNNSDIKMLSNVFQLKSVFGEGIEPILSKVIAARRQGADMQAVGSKLDCFAYHQRDYYRNDMERSLFSVVDFIDSEDVGSQELGAQYPLDRKPSILMRGWLVVNRDKDKRILDAIRAILKSLESVADARERCGMLDEISKATATRMSRFDTIVSLGSLQTAAESMARGKRRYDRG